MSYRVFWTPDAEQQIERLLADADEPQRLVAAARQIDINLARYPLSFGESRYDTVRVGIERPLGVQYEVLEDVRTVIVYAVWRIDIRRS